MIERKTCRGPNCKAEVLLVKTKNDRIQILDAEPQKRVVLVPEHADLHIPVSLKDAESFIEGMRSRVVDTFIDHHATCPDAALFRKGKP